MSTDSQTETEKPDEELMKRHVYVQLGLPDEMKEAAREEAQLGRNVEDWYLIDFAPSSEEAAGPDGIEGFSAFAPCLCCLQDASECWLMGGSEEETRLAMGGENGGCDTHEDDDLPSRPQGNPPPHVGGHEDSEKGKE